MFKITIQTWLTTCLLSTLLIIVYYNSHEHGHMKREEVLLIGSIVLGAGLVVTMAGMIGLLLLGSYLNKTLKPGQAKIICSIYLIAAGIASFIILAAMLGVEHQSELEPEMYLLPLPYILCSILFIWIFKWPTNPAFPADEPDDEYKNEVAAAYPQRLVYPVLGIGILQVGYDVYSWFHNHYIANTQTAIFLALNLVFFVLMISGLFALWQKKGTGWKLLTFLFVASVCTTVISIALELQFYIAYAAKTFLLPFAIFTALDIAAIILLQYQTTRRFYRITPIDSKTWVLAGIAYGVLHIVLSHV